VVLDLGNVTLLQQLSLLIRRGLSIVGRERWRTTASTIECKGVDPALLRVNAAGVVLILVVGAG
ncbi:hypothetical protein L9F63_011716, partial [Diploptera punctata]